MRCANGLTTEQLVLNAIATNRMALFFLTSSPLVSATFADPGKPELYFALHHDRARRYLTYLAQCALPKDAPTIDWTDPFPPFASYSFKGGLGLCPEWLIGPPSPECRQFASSCLLARNNPEGKRVPLSVRGDYPDPTVFGLLATIPADPHVPLSHDLLSSYAVCDAPTFGAARACGWGSAWVGRCDAGTSVFVSAGVPRIDSCSDPQAPILGSSTGPTVLRACDGIFGCDPGSSRLLASAEPVSCSGNFGPGLTFTCPPSGNFALMTGPYLSGDGAKPVPGVVGDAVIYPAPETSVYPQVEGAFYGDVFDPSALNPAVRDVQVLPDGNVVGDNQTIPIGQGAIFTNMWACHAKQWTAAQAYLTHRFCALPDANCAATSTGVCYDPSASSQCDTDSGAGMNAFESCRDIYGNVWPFPITTFLNQPCDLLPSGSEAYCTVSGPPPRPPPPSSPGSKIGSVAQGLILDDGDSVCDD